LNVSVGTGDKVERVLSNRLLALRGLGLEGYRCATAWMIHSADVLTLDGDEREDLRDDWPHCSYLVDGQEMSWTTRPRQKADAVVTRRRGVALAMSSADCAPLMLYDPVRQAIGLVHAGWRGTARGIAAVVVDTMRERFGCQPEQIYAGIGPSIGPCCCEVGEEVHGFFLGERQFELMPTREPYRNLVCESAVFTVQAIDDRETNGWQECLSFDLWETSRNQLLLAGLTPEHIEVAGICTSCEKARFFSYRGEHRQTGRFPSLLALRI
jgi:YfiH family protein